jgi:hypothetical protein
MMKVAGRNGVVVEAEKSVEGEAIEDHVIVLPMRNKIPRFNKHVPK